MQYEKENCLQLLMLQRYDGFPLIPKNCEESSVSCCDGVEDMRQRVRIGVRLCRKGCYVT
jgi:hypothetical protein